MLWRGLVLGLQAFRGLGSRFMLETRNAGRRGSQGVRHRAVVSVFRV